MVTPFVLVFLAVAATPETVAVKLERAQSAAAALELDVARDVLLDVVTDARATEDELRRAHLLAGEVDRILGKDVDARMHFMWVLQRDPEARLPPDKPPKITAFFELVRGEVKGATSRTKPAPPGPDAISPTSTSTTSSTTSSTSTSPTSASSPSPAGPGISLPMIVAGVGAAGVLAGVAMAGAGEVGFANSNAPWDQRGGAQALALTGYGVAVSSLAVAGVGVFLMGVAP